MNFELISIKLHPASVHFPIAFLILSTFCALIYLHWKKNPQLAVFLWGMMFLGWIGAIFACFTGLLAQSGLPPDAPYRGILNWHITTGLAQIVIYGLLLYQRWRYPFMTKKRDKRIGSAEKSGEMKLAGTGDLLDEPTAKWWLTLLLLLGFVAVIASGWNGGRLVFEWGVNVTRSG